MTKITKSSSPTSQPPAREETPMWLIKLQKSVQAGGSRFGARVSD